MLSLIYSRVSRVCPIYIASFRVMLHTGSGVAQGKLCRHCLVSRASTRRAPAASHTCTRAKTLETLARDRQCHERTRDFSLRGFFKTIAKPSKVCQTLGCKIATFIIFARVCAPSFLPKGGRGAAAALRRCQSTRQNDFSRRHSRSPSLRRKAARCSRKEARSHSTNR